MKKIIIYLLSVSLFCSTLFSLSACQKKTDKASSSESTSASAPVTATAPTTKEDDSNKVLLLSLCPSYDAYLDTLRSSLGISLEFVSQKESDDGKYLIATLEHIGISVMITYLKEGSQNIQSITLFDTTMTYSDRWYSPTSQIMCGLAFSFTEEIPSAFTIDEVTRGLKVTTEAKEYTVTSRGKYYKNGITFLTQLVAPNEQAVTNMANLTVSVEIDEHYKVIPPTNS